MIGLVIFMVISAVLLICSLAGVFQAGRREAAYWCARRTGVELQAEVVDNRASPSNRSKGTYYLTPVIRYHLAERSYEAAVVNASSIPRDRGDFMTVVVSPDSPYEPYDRYQGMGAAARGSLLFFVLAIGLVLLTLAEL